MCRDLWGLESKGPGFLFGVWLCLGVALVPLNLMYPLVLWSSGPLTLNPKPLGLS